MWLCFNNAFVSIVADREDESKLLVRARKAKHLRNLLGPQAKITETPERDYRWRAYVPRSVVSQILAQQCEGISYNNFKDSVRDHELHTMYSRWWFDHRKLQDQ